MSTRGGIARVTGTGKFLGRYHHYDSYPSGLGATLFELYNGHFARNLDRMLKTLVDDHTSWSTINDRDFTLPIGRINRNNVKCATCDRESWRHYRQEYPGRNEPLPDGYVVVDGVYNVFDHNFVYPDTPEGPECHCHDAVTGEKTADSEDCYIDEASGQGSGCEWVYAFEVVPTLFTSGERRLMHVLSSYSQDGTKMIGMFGSGDKNAMWAVRATVNLDGHTPHWKSLNGWDD